MEFKDWEIILIDTYNKRGSPCAVIAELLNCEEEKINKYLKEKLEKRKPL